MIRYLKQCWVLWKWNKAVEKGLEPSGIPLLLNLPAAERAAHDIYTIGSCICYTSDKDHITFNRISRSQMTTKIRKQRIKRAQEEWLNK